MNTLFIICIMAWISIGSYNLGVKGGREQLTKESNNKIALTLKLKKHEIKKPYKDFITDKSVTK